MSKQKMERVLFEDKFDDMQLSCPNCGWQGKGYETNIFDLYGLSKLKEVHCPSCDTYIASLRREDKRGNPEGDELSNQLG